MFHLYSVLLYVASLFYFPYMAVKLAFRGKSRAGLRQRLGYFDKGFGGGGGVSGKTVWVHAVSVGETLAAVPLVNALKERNPGIKVYFSTVTETGNAVARVNLSPEDVTFFFPFDFPSVVGRVVGRIRPDVFVVVETEIWPNLLRRLNLSGIPSLMVNGRISPRSYRGYLRIRPLMCRVLGLMTHLNMQTQADAERIKGLGAPKEKVTVAGNVKFDQACSRNSSNGGNGRGPATRAALGIPDGSVVMVAGSTHKGEEEEVVRAFRRIKESFPGASLILAPRHPERFSEVGDLLTREGVRYIRRSELAGGRPGGTEVMLLDTMGELAGLYRIGDINFVGGSMSPVGGHNVLEPVAFGKPVFFGPNMQNFAEISRILKDCGVGIEVKDGRELAREAVRLLQEPERLEALTKVARDTLVKNRGALGKNVELIERYLRG